VSNSNNHFYLEQGVWLQIDEFTRYIFGQLPTSVSKTEKECCFVL